MGKRNENQSRFRHQKELSAPPKPLSEASLRSNGKIHLGTPATRAEIIEKLIKSELMERTLKDCKYLSKGKQLLVLVNPSLVTPDLTESWKKTLKLLLRGKKQAGTFLNGIEKKQNAW